jgi:hypothetical protein
MREWTDSEIALGIGWFALWVLFGAFTLYAHNLVLPYLYLASAMATYYSHLYLACTRCVYYGKRCYLLGGIASPHFFKEREESPMDPDDSLSATAWFILGIFPVPFLLYYQDWVLLIIYSALTYGWFYYRKNIFCNKCENVWCPTKPKTKL